MKGVKKCYGLLLALLIMFGLSLSVCLDSNALKHDYNGIPFLAPLVPNSVKVIDGGYTSIDWDNARDGGGEYSNTQSFAIYARGQAYSYNDNYKDLRFKDGMKLSYLNFQPSQSNGQNLCNLSSSASANAILSFDNSVSQGFNSVSQFDRIYYLNNNFNNNFDNLTNTQSRCRFLGKFGQIPPPRLGEVATNTPFRPCKDSRYGNFSCSIQFNATGYFNDSFSNHWFTSSGFYTNQRTTLVNGEQFEHLFSLSEMYNKPITSVDRIVLPLYDYSDYWFNPYNFYQGRQFNFKGFFNFEPGEVNIHPNISNIATLKIRARVYATNPYQGTTGSTIIEFPCTSKFTNYQNPSSVLTTVWSYECPIELPFQTPYMFPVLDFDSHYNNNDNYLWLTNSSWKFGRLFVVSDNDETPGGAFGSDLPGANNPGQLSDYLNNDETAEGLFDSLINLFTLDFINPFAPIFQMFGTGDECAQIPVIAGMLSSNETQVCPFFPANIRNILTPVIGLSSAMIIFGFCISWLRGSSLEIFGKGDEK